MSKLKHAALRLLLLTFLLGVDVSEVQAAPAQEPKLSGGGPTATQVVKAVNHLKGIVAVKSSLSEADRRKKLLKAVRTIEDRGFMHTETKCRTCEKWAKRPKRKYTYRKCLRRLKRCLRRAKYWQKRRERIVTAALRAEKATGVDATLLIALGRMESDFRPLQLIDASCGQRMRFGGGRRACGADCGVTQHRLYGGAKYVRRMCKKFAKDYNLVFLKSAQEIASHIKKCRGMSAKKYHHPLRRCVLNRYNQGTFYKTRFRCKRMHKCNRIMVKDFGDKKTWYTIFKACKKRYYKCLNIAAYWTKLSCFEYGARNLIQTKPVRKGSKRRKSCRRCFRIKDIKKFYPSQPSPAKKVKTPLKVSSR